MKTKRFYYVVEKKDLCGFKYEIVNGPMEKDMAMTLVISEHRHGHRNYMMVEMNLALAPGSVIYTVEDNRK